jgi:hypothetical protein
LYISLRDGGNEKNAKVVKIFFDDLFGQEEMFFFVEMYEKGSKI